MSSPSNTTRRGFLRTAITTAMLAPAASAIGQTSPPGEREAPASDAGSMVLARITLDQVVAEQEGALSGTLRFFRAISGRVEVNWVDSFGRVAGRQVLSPAGRSVVSLPFSFNMRPGLTYINWIRVSVDGVPQTVTAKFLLSPTPEPWNDYHTISWAHYPDGFYDQLRAAGMDAIIAYTKENNDPVLDNNFRFYVEQMAWEIYSIYHKDQPEWRALLTKVSMDRENLKLWVRDPCLNDPDTIEYLRDNITEYARYNRPFRPLFYNIADELGQGDQIRPNDFCHSKWCKAKFAQYLRREHGEPSAVASAWATDQEMTHWDDAHIRAAPEWNTTASMIAYTTTDRAFESVALGAIRTRYKTIGEFNQEWGTSFPVPRGNKTPAKDAWNPILAVARDTLSVPVLTPAALEKHIGPLELANARWGGLGSWDAPNKPTGFKTWEQVIAYVNRFYRELGEVSSTRGWNVGAWCDFRNFMDETFADGVQRAAEFCKAADPHALCGTEGGQSPFAFGWYNYEQVMRVVDVIEPYNIGNNVEVIRSLKPSAIMMSTHGFSARSGGPATEQERIEQKRQTRPIWWGLFHQHNAALIWDNNEPGTRFVDMSTGRLTPSADTFSATFHELRSGIGKLFINSARLQDGIAIHYSQPSIQIHWLLDNLKHARDWMINSGGTADSVCIAVRNSWTKLIEDLALQYNFVGRKQIESGVLDSGEYKVFIMPESVAVSEKEAAEIRAFVQSGGTVIADCRAAELNARGRDLGHGLLDDLFGIGHGPARDPGKFIQGSGSEGALHLEGKHLRELRVADRTVTANGGKALASSGDVPVLIVNRVGSGRAIYMNLEIADYAYLRLKAGSNSSLPAITEALLANAGVKPQVRVLGPDGNRLPGTEIVRFANGGCEHVAIFRNPQFDDGGFGAYPRLLSESSTPLLDPALGHIDNSLLEKQAEVAIEWAGEKQTYDVRGRADLGALRTQKATLSPWEPLVYTRASSPLPSIGLAVPHTVSAGEMIEVSLNDLGTMPEGAFRIVHLKFQTPAGEYYDLYARNVMPSTLPCTERVPSALNDPKGTWKVIAHDLATGKSAEQAFELV